MDPDQRTSTPHEQGDTVRTFTETKVRYLYLAVCVQQVRCRDVGW